MFDRDLVTSGFDTETLVSERYLTYLLLAQVEAGRLPLEFAVVDEDADLDLTVVLHPPEDYQRLLYEPAETLPEAVPGSFLIELLDDDEDAFLELTINVTVLDTPTGDEVGELPFGLRLDVALEAEQTPEGFEQNHALRLSLVRFTDLTRALLEAAGADPDTVEDRVRGELDRTIPFGAAEGQQVQQIRLRKFVDGAQRSLGLYVDLVLRSGPGDGEFRAPRGNVDDAQDFREQGTPIAFATSPALFGLLGPDARFRQAEETRPGSGRFRFPLRKNPLDPCSDRIGKIKDLDIGPELGPTSGLPTGRLVIDLHGEYTDALGDPDFHLQLLLRPEIEDGVVDWDLDVDVDLGLLATLVLIAGGIALTLLFAPGLAWGSTLLVGTLAGLAVLKGLIAEPLAAKLVEDRIDEDAQASVFDALPFRLAAARRRWDPFYVTAHQIVALVDEVVIDTRGIAFEGTDVKLGRQPIPRTDVVIRDEGRDSDGAVSTLRYRVPDLADVLADLEASGPGADRRDFDRPDPQGEPTLVSLTPDQVTDRIGEDPAQRRILAPITYTPEFAHVVDNQIDQLLCASRRERADLRREIAEEARAGIEAEIRTSEGDAIRAEVTEQLEEELGREPTEDEIDDAFEVRVGQRVAEEFADRFPPCEENALDRQVDAAVARILRFDLAPEEMIELQRAGILLLDGKEVIVRRGEDGTETPYYRDRPDFDPRDNLLSLPRYSPPYEPPA